MKSTNETVSTTPNATEPGTVVTSALKAVQSAYTLLEKLRKGDATATRVEMNGDDKAAQKVAIRRVKADPAFRALEILAEKVGLGIILSTPSVVIGARHWSDICRATLTKVASGLEIFEDTGIDIFEATKADKRNEYSPLDAKEAKSVLAYLTGKDLRSAIKS